MCRVHWTTSAAGGGPDRKCTESPETHIARVRSAIGGGRPWSGPVDHPSAHLFGRRLDRTSRLAEGRRPTTPQRGRCGGCVGGDDDTYLKKKKGGPVVQSSSTTPDGAAKWRNRTCRRFQLADLWTTPPGPAWSRQRGVGGAQPITPEQCAIDAQDDSTSIGRVWAAGAACMQPGLSWVGRRPGHSNVST